MSSKLSRKPSLLSPTAPAMPSKLRRSQTVVGMHPPEELTGKKKKKGKGKLAGKAGKAKNDSGLGTTSGDELPPIEEGAED